MKRLKLQNVYGYPTVNDSFIKWLDIVKADVVVSVHNIEKIKRERSFLIVVAGLPFLDSCKIPILGYIRSPMQVWNKVLLPTKLTPNEVTIKIPKMSEPPSSESLLQCYLTGEIPEDWPKRFINSHATICFNDRVFIKKTKK